MNKTTNSPSQKTLNFLIVCFVLNVLYYPVFIWFITSIDYSPGIIITKEFFIKQIVVSVFALGGLLLWFYSVFFFYKYDKYYKGGFALLFFPGLISPFYFYNVIWKRKRELQNN